MSYHSLPEETASDPWRGAPAYVREAARAKARSWRALRLYRRRGWNESAVAYAFARDGDRLNAAIEQWAFEESNPTLF